MVNKLNQSHPDMLAWQYRTLIAELSHVNLHASDDSCPCHQVGLDPAEYCLGKHLLNIYSLAGETANMNAAHRELLEELAEEALKHHETARKIYCEGGKWPDLAQWSRDWRKKLEPYYYSCRSPKKIKRLAKSVELSNSYGQESRAMAEQKNILNHPVYIDIMVENPATGKQKVYRALVDTGATFVGLPPSEIAELGLEVVSENVPMLEASRMVFKKIYEARIIYRGQKFPLAVQETTVPLFGVMALEQFRLKVNPEKGTLEESSPYYFALLQKNVKGGKLERCIVKIKRKNIEKGCLPEGSGSKRCPNPFAVCRASVKEPRECALVICRQNDGAPVPGATTCGSQHTVTADISCPEGADPVAVVHNHPGGNPELSSLDKQTAINRKITVCTLTREHGLKCFSPE